MILRDYQRAAVDSIYGHFSKKTDNPLIVMPTGSGKAPTLTTFMREALDLYPGTRIVMLVHVRELVQQNYQTLLRIWPDAPASICSASLGKKDLRGQIVMASIQTVYKHAYDIQRCDLLIVDECHLIPHSGEGMYKRFIEDLMVINPQMKVIGFTASPFRMSSGRLDEGDGALFGSVAYEVGILELINRGFLCPPVTKAMHTHFDLTGVHTRGGEFIPAELSAAVDVDEITQDAVDEIVSYGADRRSWLAFGTSIQHALNIRDAIRSRGISCETITGKTPSAERAALVDAFKAGRIRCLTNVDVLTTGFDAPAVDLLAVLRPTKSAGLWLQIIGRGTRLSPSTGKENCLVLDFGQNSARFGPIDQINGRKRQSEGGGDAPVKECPECESILAAGVRQCPDCGFEFPPPAPAIDSTSSTAAILSSQIKPEWVAVTGVSYAKHEKPGKPPSLRVDYQCGLMRHREWVGFESSSDFARRRAVAWWHQRTGNNSAPIRVDAVLSVQKDLMAPTHIMVKPSGKYFEVVGAKF